MINSIGELCDNLATANDLSSKAATPLQGRIFVAPGAPHEVWNRAHSDARRYGLTRGASPVEDMVLVGNV